MFRFGFGLLSPGFHYAGFGAIMLIAAFLRILIIAAIIAFIVRRHKRFGGCRNSALRILDEKYAVGEMTEEEYIKRKTVLTQR